MVLILEDGTGRSDAESFVSIADVGTYATKYGLTWSGTDTEKEVAARLATQFMEAAYSARITGTRQVQTQALSWPRVGAEDGQFSAYSADDYGYGGSSVPSSTVPQAWKDAQCELSVKARTEELMPDIEPGSGSVESESVRVGPIEESKSYAASGAREFKYFRKVEGLISRYFGVSNRLVRA